MILFKHAIKRSFLQPIVPFIVLLLPIAIIFIPPPGDGYPNGMYLYGLLSLFSAFLLCKPMAEERNNKIIVRISATPTSYFTYLSSHLLAYILILGVQSIIFLIGMQLYWNDVVFDTFLIFILYFTYNMMSIAFCLFWNSLFRSFSLAFGLFSGVASVLCMVSGVSMPSQFIPESIRNFTIILPTYWITYGLNALSNDNINYVFLSYLVLLVYSGIFLLIGSSRRY